MHSPQANEKPPRTPWRRVAFVPRTSRVALVAWLLLATLTSCERPAPQVRAAGQRPNIIFLVIDTLRADRLGCYGDARGLSPTIDRLASEGILFERAIAQSPWTLPSVASYFTGFNPGVHHVTSYRQVWDDTTAAGRVSLLSDEFVTLAELLRDAGYATAGFSANGFVAPQYGFAQGFDHFTYKQFILSPEDPEGKRKTNGRALNNAAVKWLRERDSAARPFFLYMHYMDVHARYDANQTYVDPLVDAVAAQPDKRPLSQQEVEQFGKFLAKSTVGFRKDPKHSPLFKYADYWDARYTAGVPQIDQYLGELRDKLREMGLWDDAYVILAADHGEALGEHRIWSHGMSAHQNQLHVPLILRWPARVPAGQRISTTVRLFDLMPTVLAQLGLKAPATIQARSLDRSWIFREASRRWSRSPKP